MFIHRFKLYGLVAAAASLAVAGCFEPPAAPDFGVDSPDGDAPDGTAAAEDTGGAGPSGEVGESEGDSAPGSEAAGMDASATVEDGGQTGEPADVALTDGLNVADAAEAGVSDAADEPNAAADGGTADTAEGGALDAGTPGDPETHEPGDEPETGIGEPDVVTGGPDAATQADVATEEPDTGPEEPEVPEPECVGDADCGPGEAVSGCDPSGDGCVGTVEVWACVDGTCTVEVVEDPSVCLGVPCGPNTCNGSKEAVYVTCGADGACGGNGTVYLEDCDDGDPCTEDGCAVSTGCSHESVSCVCPGPGIECPSGFTCDGHACVSDQDTVYVPAGTTFFSCVPADACEGGSDEDLIAVDSFVIDRTEVSVGGYIECMEDDAACDAPTWNPLVEYAGPDLLPLPIGGVLYAEARQFCQARGGDLCSAEQWEYAARGRCTGSWAACHNALPKWPWGGAEPVCGDHAVFADCVTDSTPHPVGQRPGSASWVGAEDLVGNVSEWVLGAVDAADQVTKGGSWFTPLQELSIHGMEFPGVSESVSDGIAEIGVRCCYLDPAHECTNDDHCDDGIACTTDSCTDDHTCVSVPGPECPCGDLGAPCRDGFDCTPAGHCVDEDADRVWVPGGELKFPVGCSGPDCMGEGYGEALIWDEAWGDIPAHGFAISRHEITGAQYEIFAAEKSVANPVNADSHPVIGLSADEAAAYCNWEGGDLCNAAFWELAARGTCGPGVSNTQCLNSAPAFPWGQATPTCGHAIWGHGDCQHAGPRPVGYGPTLDVSPFGVVDMAGNVQEHVRGDGVGWEYNSIRGGAWDQIYAQDLTVYSSHPSSAGFTGSWVGFRCCQEFWSAP